MQMYDIRQVNCEAHDRLDRLEITAAGLVFGMVCLAAFAAWVILT